MGSKLDNFLRKGCFLFCFVNVVLLIQSEREISAIILTDDYLCYKEQKFL